jgi:hypothetical protein
MHIPDGLGHVIGGALAVSGLPAAVAATALPLPWRLDDGCRHGRARFLEADHPAAHGRRDHGNVIRRSLAAGNLSADLRQ